MFRYAPLSGGLALFAAETKELQRKKKILCLEIVTREPSTHTMNHPDLIVSILMSRSMGFPTMWCVRQQSLRSTCAYAQSGQGLYSSLEYSMSVELLIEHDLELLSFKRCFTGSSESTLVKMPHCWKSHVAAYMESPLVYKQLTTSLDRMIRYIDSV